jgi:diguanylate cyclase (GGDEF)-like protein/PAS domain S-box-containing protein
VSITDAAAPPSAEHEALIQFLYLAPVGLVQATSDGEIGMMNPISAQLLMPLSRDASLTNLFTALENVAPELRHLCSEFTQPSGMVCDGLHIQLNACSSQDKPVPQVLSLSLLKLDASRLMAVLNDVTVQVRRERQLRQSEAWLNALVHGITDYALVALDRHGRISEWNESIGRVTRFSDTVVGAPYSVFYPDDAMTAEHLLDRLREADGNGWSLDEGPRVRADGSRFWCSAMIAPLPERDTPPDDRDEAAYCLILRDISDKREANEQRRKAIFCDHLTGLANRRAFFEAAQLELERSSHTPRPTALILLDADHFKAVNDRFGHPAGDAVLRHLADTLAETFRQVDVVARIGGEEFAVLLPSTDLAGAAAVAERLRGVIEAGGVTFDAHAIRYTVSAGVAMMGAHAGGLDGLLKRADLALYAAKAGGRNRVHCWSDEMAAARPYPLQNSDAN